MNLRVKRHARLQHEIAGRQLAEHRLHVAGLDLREEPDLAQVHPEKRHVHFRYGPGRPQESPVAAQHDQCAGIRELADDRLRLSRRGRPVGDAPHLAPALGALAQVQRRLFGGL